MEAVGAGLPLVDFHLMTAFTAGDLLINPVRITGRDDVARRMLFHEVVHVHEYLSGVIAPRDYRDLPLERVADAAQDRYMLNPQAVFSVDEMVRNVGCVTPLVWLDEHGRPRAKRPCPRSGYPSPGGSALDQSPTRQGPAR